MHFVTFVVLTVHKLLCGVGVECSRQRIAALLYVDDMVLFAADEVALCRSLRMLQEWCKQWAV